MSVQALLLDEAPLVAQRSLVRLLGGHDAAIFVQQVHYATRVGREHDGVMWAVRSNDEWCEDAVLTPRVFKRIVKELGDLGVLITVQAGTYDRTSWRRVDYQRLSELLAANAQVAPIGTNGTDGSVRGRTDGWGTKGTDGWGTKGTDVPLERDIREEKKKIARGDRGSEHPTLLPDVCERPVQPAMRAVPRGYDVDALFEQFWRVYPKRVARKDARRAFEKALRDTQPTDIGAGLRAWCVEWEQRDEIQFVPYPATWLNRRQWETPPPPPAAKPTTVLERARERSRAKNEWKALHREQCGCSEDDDFDYCAERAWSQHQRRSDVVEATAAAH